MEPIYVIHKDGKRWDKSGRKVAYLRKGSAKGVITKECHMYAYDVVFDRDDYYSKEYKEIYDKAYAEEESRFEIVEYVPKQ